MGYGHQNRWHQGAVMSQHHKTYEQLRSARWFEPDDFRSFGHRSRAMQMGYDHEDWKGKPIIAILNTWSDIGNCHSHFKNRVEEVKRGVLQAGGFPLEIPCISVAENFVKPTTMLYRNLLAIEAEEQLRCHPVDGAVLMGGCDKTTPGLLMGAFSAGLPCIYLPAGPMLRGNWKGKTLGSGSDAFKYWDERRAGNITDTQWMEIEGGIARSAGTCMGHGHGGYHDGDRGGAWHDFARSLKYSGSGRESSTDGDAMRSQDRQYGVGRPHASTYVDPQEF
jgi:dihydroxyacid dehydratase/phosphogluconate dehydratase